MTSGRINRRIIVFTEAPRAISSFPKYNSAMSPSIHLNRSECSFLFRTSFPNNCFTANIRTSSRLALKGFCGTIAV